MDDVKRERNDKFLLAPLIVLMLAQVGTTGDNSVLSISAASIIKFFGANMHDVQISNMVYPLVAGAFMITGGMLGIKYGWKKMFRIGVFLAAIGEIVIFFSTSLFVFIWIGRLLVGLGGSLMIPSVLGLVPSIYQGHDRAVAFGAIGAASGLATAMPILMGIILDKFGFKVAFGIMAIYFIIVLLGSSVLPDKNDRSSDLPLDFKGIILATTGLFLLLIGLSNISQWGFLKAYNDNMSILGISPAPILMILGLIVLYILVQVEKKVEKEKGFALMPRSFLETRQVRNGLYASAMIFLTMGVFNAIVVPYIQVVAGFNALQTGLVAVLGGISLFIVSLLVPKLLRNVTSKRILRMGYIFIGLGFVGVALSLNDSGFNIMMLVMSLVVIGIGWGFLSAQASFVVADATNKRDAEQSGGIQATARNVGQAIGVALTGTILLASLTFNVHSFTRNNGDILDETRDVLLSESRYTLTDNATFRDSLGEYGISDGEKDIIVNEYSTARTKASRTSLYVTAAISLLCILGTNGIEDKKQSKDQIG